MRTWPVFMRLGVVGLAGVLLWCGGGAASAQDAGYHVQLGAFPTAAEAQAKASDLARVTPREPVVAEVATDEGATMYRVIVPGFGDRVDADAALAALKAREVAGLVRHDNELSCTLVREAADGADARRLFARSTRAVSAAPRAAAAAGGPGSRAAAVLGAVEATPTTSPAFGLVMRDVLLDLEDSDPGKAQAVLRAAHRTLVASPMGKPRPAHWKELKRALGAVAEGRVAAEETSVTAARRQVCHILHYYDRDKVAALRGYRQLLAEAVAKGDVAAASDLRMQIGAASFEVAKENRLSLERLYPAIADLWMENSAVEQAMGDVPTGVAETVRRASARLALMLPEIRMLQGRWAEVLELDEVIIARYSEHPDCKGEVAEAYTHAAHAWIYMKDYSKVEETGMRAVALADELGRPVWGDPCIDVAWKGYCCMLVGAQVLNQPASTVARLQNEMRRRFPDHPQLKMYIP